MKIVFAIFIAGLSVLLVACGSDQQESESQPEIISYSNSAQGLEVTIQADRVNFNLDNPPNTSGQASCGSFSQPLFSVQSAVINQKVEAVFPIETLEAAEYCQLTWNSDQNSVVVVFNPQATQQATSSSYGQVDLDGENLTVNLETGPGESLSDELVGSKAVLSCQYNGVQQQVQVSQIVDWTAIKQTTTLPVDLSGQATSCQISKQGGSAFQSTLFSFTENGK